MLRKLSVSLLMLAMVLVGCEKSSFNSDTVNNKKYGKSGTEPANVDNAYDFIGKSHNDQLMTFVDSMKSSGSYEYNFIYDHFYVKGMLDKVHFESVIIQANYDPNNYTGIMDSLYSVHSELFEQYLYIRSIVNDSNDLKSKINALIAHENDLDYSNYNSNESMALFATFSVARYSMYLWASSEEGGLHYNKGGNLNKYIGGNKKTHDIVMADIGGTFTSALFTWNPATALAGGVASSAWEWAFY